MTAELRKAGANWVIGERFFDRERELATLKERVDDRTHTLITAQRRMGKTSLVRELLRQLNNDGEYETLFVDLEGAENAGDAIAEIAFEARSLEGVWPQIRAQFSNFVQSVSDRVDSVTLSASQMADVKIQLRGGVASGNWRESGDRIFASLSQSEKPIVLAIDELPILVNRLLKGHDFSITTDRREATDLFLSWLRLNGQAYRDKITLIISGSVGLEPILRQAGLSAHANIFSSFELRHWDEATAMGCLGALARSYGMSLPDEVQAEMCRRLRCCIPHHVQQFFDYLHQHLRQIDRPVATLEDVAFVYERDILGVRGQIDLEHYESRLRMILGDRGYRTALDLLTEAAVNEGVLTNIAVGMYIEEASDLDEEDAVPIGDVIYSLEHDGYFERHSRGYRYVSGLLQDWWHARHSAYFTSIEERVQRREETT